jgi:hypothetical protein
MSFSFITTFNIYIYILNISIHLPLLLLLLSEKGIEKLRQVYGLPDIPYNRLLAMEHTDKWAEALRTYETQKLFLPSYDPVPRIYHSSTGVDSECGESRAPPHLFSAPHSTGSPPRMRVPATPSNHVGEEIANALARVGRRGMYCSTEELATIAFIERGRLRCLYEMGQLDAVIDQVMGCDRRDDSDPLLLLHLHLPVYPTLLHLHLFSLLPHYPSPPSPLLPLLI